ncbi:hypothetical protein SK128_006665 [Halocaridina rubra]|uniref:Vitellogenin domain-containing protein n=1 Tax=Halocaridina rubra TaxID=373956 RepID=A0AAN8X3B3_HALRR
MSSSPLSPFFFLVAHLLAYVGANADPWPPDLPRCSTECPIMGSSILHYLPETTYTYAYSGRSQVHLQDIPDGVSYMDWSARVDLTWIGPCDVAISFKNVVVNGVRSNCCFFCY